MPGLAPPRIMYNGAMSDKIQKIQVAIGIAVGLVTLVVGVTNAKNLLFSKKGPGAVSIQVRADGKPAPAAVQITKVQGGLVANAQTGNDGSYEKKPLEPGNYGLKVEKAGYQPETLLFAVEPGQTAELTVALKPAAGSIRSALEETSASWIKQLGKPKPDPAQDSEPTNPP